MIRANFSFHNVYALPLAQLAKYLPYRCFVLSVENFSSIFRGENYVVFAIPFRSVYKELHADHETGTADNK